MTNITTKAKNQEKSKMTEIDDQILKMFEFKKRLGKGAYGIVWKAIDKRSNETVAVKKIFDAFRDETDAQRTFREITFLNALRSHPNIVMLHNVFKASNNLDIYLIFEFMDTDLHNIIKRGAILKDVHKRYIMYQLINAVKYIHSGNVIHRDLKPSNILVDSKCRCKLADFGLARSLSFRDISKEDSTGALTDYVATRWYRAPEILVASKRYTKGIDMWSLGCILGEMLLGKPLFQGTSTVNQIERIVMTLPKITDQDVKSVGADYGAVLLNKQVSRERCISLDDMLGEVPPDSIDLVKKLLVLDPLERLTAQQALEHPYVAKYRNPGTEKNVQGNIVPPLNDDIRLTVPEYRTKLYEIVGEIPGTNKKQVNSQKKGQVGNQKTILAYDNIPQAKKNKPKTPKTQTHEDTKCAMQGKVITKSEIKNISTKTMIGSISSKVTVINVSKKESPPQEGTTLPSFNSQKSKVKSTRTSHTGNIDPVNDIIINNSLNGSSLKICGKHSLQMHKMDSSDSPIKARSYTNYPKTNVNTLAGQHQKENLITKNGSAVISNYSDKKIIPHILPTGNKEQTQSQCEIKSFDLCSMVNQNLQKNTKSKNLSHRVPTGSGRKQTPSSLVLPLLVCKNGDKVDDDGRKLDLMKATPIKTFKNDENSMERAVQNQMLLNVTQKKSREPFRDKPFCYEERLRRVTKDVKYYERAVQTFAYDTMLLTQKRLRSAESLMAIKNQFVPKAEIILNNSKTSNSLDSKCALAGRVSFAGPSFGQPVTNHNYKNHVKSAVPHAGNDNIKNDWDKPEKSSILGLPTSNAKNPILKMLTSYRRKLSSRETGTGGSGDHISSNVEFRQVEGSFRDLQKGDQRYKLKRNVSSLLKNHLAEPHHQSQLNVQTIQCSGSNQHRNLESAKCYNSYCKRKSVKSF